MRTCPGPGSGTSNSTILRPAPAAATWAAFIVGTAIAVVMDTPISRLFALIAQPINPDRSVMSALQLTDQSVNNVMIERERKTHIFYRLETMTFLTKAITSAVCLANDWLLNGLRFLPGTWERLLAAQK